VANGWLADREGVLSLGVECARVERGTEAKLGERVRPVPREEHGDLAIAIRGAARSAITSASGVSWPNSMLNAYSSLAKAGAAAALATWIGIFTSRVMRVSA
jgi:hypothetical protein